MEFNEPFESSNLKYQHCAFLDKNTCLTTVLSHNLLTIENTMLTANDNPVHYFFFAANILTKSKKKIDKVLL